MYLALDNNPNSDLYFRLHLLSLCNWIFCKWKPVVGEGVCVPLLCVIIHSTQVVSVSDSL